MNNSYLNKKSQFFEGEPFVFSPLLVFWVDQMMLGMKNKKP
ncbi:hypothetical protein [Flavilitoribacter nigricans]|nr:hypothetical protein [Flavilitoribacter nigricans]